jgi:hypothetical protein
LEEFLVTTATLASPGRNFGFGMSSVSAGVSDTAEHLASQLKRVFLDTVRTASGQAVILPAQSSLSAGYKEATRLATGGDEQVVPTSAAMREADELLTALPQWCIAPAPTVEPSGAIAFEWDLGPSRWLVLALKGTGMIEYSAILGLGNEMHGTRNFAGTLGRHEIALLSELIQTETPAIA